MTVNRKGRLSDTAQNEKRRPAILYPSNGEQPGRLFRSSWPWYSRAFIDGGHRPFTPPASLSKDLR